MVIQWQGEPLAFHNLSQARKYRATSNPIYDQLSTESDMSLKSESLKGNDVRGGETWVWSNMSDFQVICELFLWQKNIHYAYNKNPTGKIDGEQHSNNKTIKHI